ncbi:MAG TPA: SPOR domain-containing protein [Steroidobacteraceae bacterium]
MEQQAKERLTGGVILVVLLVLLVPELLTGPRPVSPPVATQPDQAPMRSYTLELGASAHGNNTPVAASTAVPPASAPAPPHSAPQPLIHTAPVSPLPEATRAPLPAPPPAPAPSPAHNAVTWTVQLGTFSSRENATRLMARLKTRGFAAFLSEATKSGHKLYRVRVGTERDRTAAQKLQGRLKAAGEKGTQIVPR